MRGLHTVRRGHFGCRRTRRRAVDLQVHGRGEFGFTLIELMVVITILALLMAIMSASLVKVRAAGQSFVCKNQLKNVAFDFIQFADDYAHPYRGDSEKYGRAGFDIEDFQERLYGVSEFWKGAVSQPPRPVKFKASEQPLICPAGSQELTKVGPPSALSADRAVGPLENVSIGFNMRLYYGSIQQKSDGPFTLAPVRLSKRIMNQWTSPLVFDVDGEAALAKHPNMLPYYSAPPVGPNDNFASSFYWYPSLRHGGRCNAAFIGGHVLSSSIPDREPGWNWKYQPPVN